MRISGGVAKGITLQVPKGNAVRPATDGMRQALFSSLGASVVGARFLDLFAGSGAYGLEALSRGAAGGVWVEQHKRTVELLKRNVAAVCQSLGRSPRQDLTVMTADATTVPWPDGQEAPELVFADPPYPIIAEAGPKVFARIDARWSAAEAPWVLFELPGGTELEPTGWTCVKRIGRGKGQPSIAVFRRETGADAR